MTNLLREAGGVCKGQEPVPRRYVLLRIPKTASTWLDETTWRMDVLAMRRAPLRGARRIDWLGERKATICPVRENYPWSVFARYQYARFVGKVMLANEIMVPRPHKYTLRNFLREKTGRLEKHIPWSELPEWMREFPVVAVLREVLSWHLSRWLYITSFPAAYEYLRLNRMSPGMAASRMPERRRRFVEQWLGGEMSRASWGNLSANGYWHLTHHMNLPEELVSLPDPPRRPGVGFYTMRLLKMIHRDPERVLGLSEPELEEYFASGRWRGDVCRGWFLRQERLMEDAHRVLVGEIGYRREDLERVLSRLPERLNAAEAGRKERARQELFGNEALCDEILHAERFAHQYILPGLTQRAPEHTPAT